MFQVQHYFITSFFNSFQLLIGWTVSKYFMVNKCHNPHCYNPRQFDKHPPAALLQSPWVRYFNVIIDERQFIPRPAVADMIRLEKASSSFFQFSLTLFILWEYQWLYGLQCLFGSPYISWFRIFWELFIPYYIVANSPGIVLWTLWHWTKWGLGWQWRRLVVWGGQRGKW